MATVHLGERHHECAVCGAAFGEAGNLRRHQAQVHEARRPFECPECG